MKDANEALQVRLGGAVRRLRLERDLHQKTVAEFAGASLTAVRNLELGRGATVATLVGVVEALGAADWLDALAPPPTVSPMAMLRQQRALEQQQRKRVTRKRQQPRPVGGETDR